jgi:hypothetical protein
MDYRLLTSLVLRLTGVFIIVSAVTAAPRSFLSLLQLQFQLQRRVGTEAVDIWPLLGAAATAFAIPFLVGLLLVYFRAPNANRMVSASTETAGLLLLQQVAFSVLGLYLMTMAAFDAVYWWAKLQIYSAVYEEAKPSGPFRLTEDDFASIVSTGEQFIGGMAVMLGGRGIANLLHRLRTQPPVPEPPSIQEGPAS